MSKNERRTTNYRFDGVTIDCRDFRVSKNGEFRRITPRAFEVLLYLVEHAGRVVGKQELFDEVWKENFVTDNALTRMIKEVRQVIGDEADAPRYIETVPKRGYRFIAPVKTEEEPLSANDETSISSIAVLPFVNVGTDADSEYLSEAITESVINDLSRLPDLRVVPRSVVFSFGRREVNPLNAGRELKVRAVASGRVLLRGDALIVSVELVDVDQEAQLWGEKYQYKTADIFDLQEEIARKISAQLRSKLLPEKSPPTPNPEAYRLYLKGRYFWNRRPQGLFKGIEYFERALAEDEKFALALAGLADSYSTLGSWENGALPPNVAMPKACAAALNALALDNTLAEAHTTLAYTKFHYDWKFTEAETEIRHALELDPNYVHAHHWLSHIHMAQGETEKSLAASRRALALDPLDLIVNVHLAWHFWLGRAPDEAIVQTEKTRELEPGSIWSGFFAGLALEQKGRFEEAAAEFRGALAISPQEVTLVRAALGHALGNLGETREARQILDDLERQRAQKFVPAYDIAMVRLGLGEKTAALDWLAEAVREHSGWIAYLGVESRLDPLREIPQFDLLLQQVGLRREIKTRPSDFRRS